MNEKISALKAAFEQRLAAIQTAQELEDTRVSFLGKKGLVTEALKGMGGLSDEMKRTLGKETNELKNAITVALAEKLEALSSGRSA